MMYIKFTFNAKAYLWLQCQSAFYSPVTETFEMLSSFRDLKTWYHAKLISIWCGLRAGFKKSVNKWKKILPEYILRSLKNFKNLRKSKDTLISKRFYRTFFSKNSLIPSLLFGDLFMPVMSTHCVSSCVDRLHVVMHGFALPYDISLLRVCSPVHLYTHVHLHSWLRTLNCLSGQIHFFHWMKFVLSSFGKWLATSYSTGQRTSTTVFLWKREGTITHGPLCPLFCNSPSLDILLHVFSMGDVFCFLPFSTILSSTTTLCNSPLLLKPLWKIFNDLCL